MNRISTVVALGYLFASGSSAQSDVCDNVDGFYHYDAHGEYEFTGFFSSPTSVSTCECGGWKYSGNIVGTEGDAVQNWYLDTQGEISGTETNENTGVCTEGLRVFDNNVYFFSKEVLERSLNDPGDCSVMLGEQCANALQMHYLREGVKYAWAGDCPGSANVEWNKTVPWECAGLVGNSEEWLQSSTTSQLWSANANPRDSIEKVSQDNGCPGTDVTNGRYAHLLGSVNVSVNQAFRFPSPTFFTFFPNSTEIREEIEKTYGSPPNFDNIVVEDKWNGLGWSILTCVAANETQSSDSRPIIQAPEAEELLAEIPDDAELPITVSPISTPSATATATASGIPTGGCNSTHGDASASATYYVTPRSTGDPFSTFEGAATRSSVGALVGFIAASVFIVAAI